MGTSLTSKHKKYTQLPVTPNGPCSTYGDPREESALRLMVSGRDLYDTKVCRQ